MFGSMQGQGMQRPPRSVEDRISTVASVLAESLTAVATSVAGPALRTTRLAARLNLDKSLASRLLRAIRAESMDDLVHFIPSPTGLGMFLNAAEANGAPPDLCRKAREAVEEFRELLEELPGGRSALDTWISQGATDVRKRAERTAKQAVYRGMSHLLGFHCETVASALILQPSGDGRTADGIEVSQRAKVRRLRPDTPVALFSIDLAKDHAVGPTPRIEPLSADADPADPSSYLLPRFCQPEAPALELFREASHHVFALSDEHASVHQPVTITSAMVVRHGWSTHRSEGELTDGRNYLLHYPCRLLVRDLYLRDDLYVGVEPELFWEFPTPGATPRRQNSTLPRKLNSIDVWAPIEHLGLGAARWAIAEIPDQARLIAHAFATTGWDPSRFRGYRVRVVYPVPMVLMGWRVTLPLSSAPLP